MRLWTREGLKNIKLFANIPFRLNCAHIDNFITKMKADSSFAEFRGIISHMQVFFRIGDASYVLVCIYAH